MAAPDAPTKPELEIGPVPHSIQVYNAVVATAVKYTTYISGITGVGQAAFNVKQEGAAPDMEIHDLPSYEEIFVAQTATNVGAEESLDSTENSLARWE